VCGCLANPHDIKNGLNMWVPFVVEDSSLITYCWDWYAAIFSACCVTALSKRVILNSERRRKLDGCPDGSDQIAYFSNRARFSFSAVCIDIA